MTAIEQFQSLYGLPDAIQLQLDLSVDSPEHPIYHPEGTLDKHIEIVMGRALELDVAELHFAALLHDITKSGYCPILWEGRKGGERETPNGTYWRNPEHPQQAVRFLLLPQIQDWMLDNFVDVWTVADLCLNHMNIKEHLYGRWSCGNVVGREFFKTFGVEYKLMPVYKTIREDYNYWDLAYYFSSYCDNMLV